eukprot:TRINITY_DN75193_c0_g1_i1.p1 TRINITY_DN75193_c0_g1~~TRINITY_DN75193_c0_g1_i1.p1  ORF type:complete len:675 (-),score=91.80 TRINITY_DN75193_c0_g1_i1:188-2152(-)
MARLTLFGTAFRSLFWSVRFLAWIGGSTSESIVPSPSCIQLLRSGVSASQEALTQPLVGYFDGSSKAARKRGWGLTEFTRDFGSLTCAVYPRMLWDQLKSYPTCGEFVEALPPPNVSSAIDPAPLALSFSIAYNGYAEVKQKLKKDVSLPRWVETVIANRSGEPAWSLSVGANLSGIQFHGTHGLTISSLMSGRKRWLLLPPDALETLRAKKRSDLYWRVGNAQLLPGKAYDDFLWNRIVREVPGAVDCTQEPNTVMMLPDCWGHATYNVGAAVSVGVQVAFPEDGSAEKVAGRCKTFSKIQSTIQAGNVPAAEKPKLLELLRKMLKHDPLSTLRDHWVSRDIWKLIQDDPKTLKHMCASVTTVLDWLRKTVSEGRMSPEHATSAALALFPFGITMDPDSEVGEAAENVIEASFSWFASVFDDPDRNLRSTVAVMIAAMAAEKSDTNMASLMLSAHLAYDASEGSFVAVLQGGKKWQRCMVVSASEESIQVQCFMVAKQPGRAIAAAHFPIFEDASMAETSLDSRPWIRIGDEVQIEEVKNGWARLSAPVQGWAMVRDVGKAVVLGVLRSSAQIVTRESGLVGWRAGSQLRSLQARLAAEWFPAFRNIASVGYQGTDPTVSQEVGKYLLEHGGIFARARRVMTSAAAGRLADEL